MAINLFGRQAAWSREGEEVDEEADRIDIPHHAFDLVIADECHRGYTTAEEAVWRNTLDHFDAIKIGLTATPAAHTKAYFTDVVYRYEYSRAVREGFLVDYDVVAVRSDVRMKGIFLKEGEQIVLVDPDTGSELRDRKRPACPGVSPAARRADGRPRPADLDKGGQLPGLDGSRLGSLCRAIATGDEALDVERGEGVRVGYMGGYGPAVF